MTVNEELHVGISEYKIAQAPTRLITVGLGSCIGTIIYDEVSHIGGLSQISVSFTHQTLRARGWVLIAGGGSGAYEKRRQ